jgi:putative aldouronate transport system substrate-binding protein
MKKIFGKFFLTGLCLLAGGNFIFAAGGQAKPSTAAGAREKLLIGIQTNAFITEYKDNKLTQFMEKLHNVDLDFYLLPTAGAEVLTKISLMASSNDLPDIFLVEALSREQILSYGANGAFIPLNKYLNDPSKAPNFAKVPEPDKTDMFQASISADGNIYSLPRWEAELWNLTPHRIYLNKAWLDKLGLPVPKTTDDLRNVLLAFRDRDPNGNGKKDEIGIYGWFGGGYGENIIAALINSFIFYNQNNLALDPSGNRVTAPFIDPAFRKALVYLNGLYKDGVLAASLFTDNQQQFRATLNVNPGVVGLTSAGSFSNWSSYVTNENFKGMTVIEPLTGPDGVSYTPYTGYVPTQVGFITSKCKNPDLAFRFLDSFFDPHVSLTARYGEEGVDWSQRPEDLKKTSNVYVEMGLYPSLSIVEMSSIWSNPSSQFWRNVNPRWSPIEESLRKGDILIPYDPSLPQVPAWIANYQYYRNRHPEKILPVLRYSMDDVVKNAEAITNVNEYVRQAIAEFVTGIRDINNNAAWNTYLQELNNMGLPQWLSSSQATYDRQK